MGILFSHPTGNANVRAAALGLNQAGLLSEFRTSIASFPNSFLDSLGAVGPLSEIRRRRFDPSLRSITRTWPWLEAGRLIASRAGINGLVKHETGLLSIDAVYRNLDLRIASSLANKSKKGIVSVYAYEDGALKSFQEAKKANLQCIYDLPIGYWRTAKRLLEKESIQKPEWASTLINMLDSEEKLARKDEELRLANLIFVASTFTARTLDEYVGKLAPIEVIPYGFPPVDKSRKLNGKSSSKPLKLLFVGGLSQRKGIAELFSSVDALGQHVELTVVGHKACHNSPALDTALAKHNWIPSLPNSEILKLMQVHDVLVFPSLFEGFGLVITEAMSQGTPVITTDRTAGPDLIVDGYNGWLVEAGSTDSLQEAIEKLIDNPTKISAAGRAALETARNRPWEAYGRELAEAIQKYQ